MPASDVMAGGVHRGLLRQLVGLTAAAVVASPLQAQLVDEGRWSITPRISLAQTYTDNVNLSPPGNEDWDLITEVSPGLSITRDTRRLSLAFDYSLINRAYWRDDRGMDASHVLRASSTTEVVRNNLFFDAEVSRREQPLSALTPVGIGGDVGRSGVQEVTTWRAGPRYQQRFGTFANLNTQYTVDGVHYHSGGRSDSIGQQASAVVASGTRFTLVDWALRGSWRTVDFDEFEDDVTLSEAAATVGVNPTAKLRFFGTVGREWNDFQTGFSDREGEFWNVGASYAMTNRTSFEASYGERFFGTTRAFAVNQRNRRTVFRAERAQTLSTSRDPRLVQVDEILIIGPEGEQVGSIPLFDPVLFDRVFVVDSTTVTMTLNMPKTTWTLAGSIRDYERRSTGDTVDDDFSLVDDRRERSLRGQLSWRLSGRSTATATLGYTESDYDNLDRIDERYLGQLGLNRSLGRNTTGSLTYRHQRLESTDDSQEYRENAVIGRVTMTF